MSDLHFDQLSYPRPDRSALEAQHKALLAAWDSAGTTEERAGVVMRWDRERRSLESFQRLAAIRFTQDTRSEERKAAKAFSDEIDPDIRLQNQAFLRRVVEAPDGADLRAALGDQAFNMWKLELESFSAEVADLRREESRLQNRYSELKASIRIPFQGKEYGLTTLAGLYGDASRDTRLGARRAQASAMQAHQEELDELYDKLVKLRHQMAGILGFETFTPLGYRLMGRSDYDDKDVAIFRQQVRDQIVPLAARIIERRGRTLGLTDYSYHDESVADPRGVPRPKGDHDWMLARAQERFDELGDDFGAFFRMMCERGLLDLKSRDGKAGGGYCDMFSDLGMPFIFANFNGTQDDVQVFTHECGHAFQVWSARNQPLRHYHWPTYEAAEIHSMSLELLTFPGMERFFGADAERFRIGHLESAILFLPYGVAVDEFQHLVYANPAATPAERAEMWQQVERTYIPWRRYDDIPYFEGGRLWQRQGHIYSAPFYYIDYCLAQACALQFWRMAEQDREATMTTYRALCDLGGSQPFTGLVAAAGLRNPLADGCLEEVAGPVADFLGLA